MRYAGGSAGSFVLHLPLKNANRLHPADPALRVSMFVKPAPPFNCSMRFSLNDSAPAVSWIVHLMEKWYHVLSVIGVGTVPRVVPGVKLLTPGARVKISVWSFRIARPTCHTVASPTSQKGCSNPIRA